MEEIKVGYFIRTDKGKIGKAVIENGIKIISIVTREQFNSMKYIVND